MTLERSKLLSALGRMGFLMRAGVLALVLLLVFAAAAPIGFRFSGATGVWAAGLATALCFVGGLAALSVTGLFHGLHGALYGMLTGMALRTGLPLAVGAAIHLTNPTLAGAGLMYFLLASYLAALAVETLLAVAQARQDERRTEI